MAVIFSKLFTGGTGFWDVGANITQPIFDGRTILHRERAAKAAYTQASEQYRSTVLTAIQNVADTLNALQQDADALKAAAAAKDAATVTLDLARKQFQAGYVNYLALLNAEQSYQQAVINLVQSQANRYADTAALFQALGGGWWNRPDIPKN
jgi:outer membrane protein TolC